MNLLAKRKRNEQLFSERIHFIESLQQLRAYYSDQCDRHWMMIMNNKMDTIIDITIVENTN